MKTCDAIFDQVNTPVLPPNRGHMPGAKLAEFYERRGYPVFESGGVFWRRFKGPIYSTLPCHVQLEPQEGEIEELLRMGRLAAVRFPVRGPGLPTGLYVVRPSAYTLVSVCRKQRGHVKTGLEHCEIRDVAQDELLAAGIQLNRDTMDRQARYDPEFAEPRSWHRFVRAVYACPAFHVTGAYVNARLSAYLISFQENPWLHLLFKMSRTEDLQHFPNHALDYAVIRRAAEDPSIQAIENGITPLGNPGLDQYKRQMGYDVVPHPLGVQFHPAFSPWIANREVLGVLSVLRGVFPRQSLNIAAMFLEGAIARRTGDRPAASASPIEPVCARRNGSHALLES
jgi:hypothetical protein